MICLMKRDVTVSCVSYHFSDTDQRLVSLQSNLIKPNQEWQGVEVTRVSPRGCCCLVSLYELCTVSACYPYIQQESGVNPPIQVVFPDTNTRGTLYFTWDAFQ